jgi:hypothetical protein
MKTVTPRSAKEDEMVKDPIEQFKKGKTKVVTAKEGKWIQSAIKKPGALRQQLGIKGKKPIPAKMLDKAAKAPGKLGQRARLAKTLKGMK